MKIPFDIKYRPQIESGEYKVETRDGTPARIICWDASELEPIVAVVSGRVHQYAAHGYANYLEDNDLFIIIQKKEELTPFEVAVKSWMGVAEDIVIDDSWVKNCAKDLLSLARKELQSETNKAK